MRLVPQLEDTWLVQNGSVMLRRITIIMRLESSEFHAAMITVQRDDPLARRGY